MTYDEILMKVPVLVSSFIKYVPYTKFLCRMCILALFFLVYPGSIFEMLFLTQCPKELMILIVVKKEQEYKIHAAL